MCRRSLRHGTPVSREEMQLQISSLERSTLQVSCRFLSPSQWGQIPIYYNYKPSARGCYHQPGTPDKPGRDYVNMDPNPLFDFGYGLSYTKFKYSLLRVKPGRIAPAGEVTVSVNVKNIGKRAGKEIVQLYINDVVSTVTTPVRSLKGFEKVNLRPGQTKTVSFTLKPEDMALLDEDMKWVVEPGKFEVMVGDLKKSFEVV